jgi:GT2 family glycosyltransferase
VTTTPRISVIIVNFNGRHWLDRCLRAALAAADHAASADAAVPADGARAAAGADAPAPASASSSVRGGVHAAARGAAAPAGGSTGQGDVEIILVDNGSRDGSVEFVREQFPAVRLLALDENLGFTGGNNRGVAEARGEWLAFLNNDTVADPQWLARLGHTLASDPAIGLVTSRIVYMDDPMTIDSAGDGYLRAGGAFKRGHGQPATRYEAAGPVFGACGAACMIRRTLFETLGGFDPAFFMAFEDVDLSYGVQLTGHDCRYVPDAIVHHAGSASLGRLSDGAVFYGQRNLEWVYVKNTPWPLLLRSFPSHILYSAAAGLYFARSGNFAAFLRAKWSAMKGLPTILAHRRSRQRLRTASSRRLWSRMEPRWMALKLREKKFDLQAAGKSR